MLKTLSNSSLPKQLESHLPNRARAVNKIKISLRHTIKKGPPVTHTRVRATHIPFFLSVIDLVNKSSTHFSHQNNKVNCSLIAPILKSLFYCSPPPHTHTNTCTQICPISTCIFRSPIYKSTALVISLCACSSLPPWCTFY